METEAGGASDTYTLAAHAPWREILRYRWSSRHDRALVLNTGDGCYHLLSPRRPHGQERKPTRHGQTPPEPGRAAMPETAPPPRLLRGYDRAFHVQIAERTDVRSVRLPDEYGPPEPVSVRLRWWVHDPVQVVRTQTAYGWEEVRGDVDRRLRELQKRQADGGSLGLAEVRYQLAVPGRLDDCGISYRVTDVQSRDADNELLLAPAGAGDFPYAWTANRREEYDFCLQAVRNGPVSLAALWLLRQPDQVRDVLDWAVAHQDLTRQEAGWQEQVTGLLGALSEEERQELSELLRDRLVSLGRRVPPQERGASWPT